MTLHARESVRSSLDDSVYSSKDIAKAAPKYRFPNDEWRPEDAFAVVVRRADARRQRPPEPGDVLPDVGGARGPPADGPGHRQEHDRQGRVPADRGDRAALRAHARRPLERPGVGEHGRGVGDRLVGGVHVGRDGGEVALAGEAGGGRSAHRSSEHGVRTGPGRVAQVRQVLGHRDARGADVTGPLRDGRRRHARNASTRTRSWSCRRSASPTPAPTSWSSRSPTRSTRCRPTPASTSTSTSTGRVVRSWHRSARPTSSGTSGCRGSSRSARRGTSSGWRRWASAGSSGATSPNCPTI